MSGGTTFQDDIASGQRHAEVKLAVEVDELDWQSALMIRVIRACWTVLPAVYFFFEFHWARATQATDEFERVKESQKAAQKVWASVVVALAVIYLRT